MMIASGRTRAPSAFGLAALVVFAVGCGAGTPESHTARGASAPRAGCQPTLPEIPTGNRPPGLEARLVDPTPAHWGVNLPEGAPLRLDGSMELQPLHVRVAHRFDPQIEVNQKVDAQIYLIFPRNDFTVTPPKTGWVEQPGSDATVVYCGEVHGKPTLARRERDEVFWITPHAARPFSIQWQIAGTAEVGPLSTRLRGFSFEVTP
jgi:hypothetical protein